MTDESRLGRRTLREYDAAMSQGERQDRTAERCETVTEAVARVTPWTLVVTFAEGADYDEAERLTGELLFPPDDAWELRPVVQYQPVHRRIRIGGQRRELFGPVGFYMGGWESAQLELRPTSVEG